MYGVDVARHNSSSDERVDQIIVPLLREVLGYNEQEIKEFKHWLFFPPLAMNLTKEEVRLIMQPFWDNNISVWAFEINDNGECVLPEHLTSKFFGVISQPPQSHYYDKPVVTRDKLINPNNPPTNDEMWIHPNLKLTVQSHQNPTITCPYCKSTNTKKITNTSKAIHTAFFGIFSLSRNNKQWHCNGCGSDF